MAVKKPRKSAFVPRMLIRTALVGVIPACALACGGSDTTGPTTTGTDSGSDAAKDTSPFGVAAVAYPAYETGTDTRSDGPTDSKSDSNKADASKDSPFGVAAVAYPAYESGTPG